MKKEERQTIFFNNKPYIIGHYSIVGPKEGKGNLRDYFSEVSDDDFFGQKTYEKAERVMLERALKGAVENAGISYDDIKLFLSGDLLNQIISSSYAARSINIPYVGVFGACSTMAESLALGACLVDGGHFETVACATSSHFSTAERQFRYPLEYGIFKKETTTITVSGAASCIISREKSRIRVNHATIGKVEDVVWDNVSDMGTPMSYAAYTTIKNHLINTSQELDDFDLILTGDLSTLGSKILKESFLKDGINLVNHLDAGCLIYGEDKSKFMGGSGSACIGLTSFGYIFKKMINKEYKKVLLVGTGALHSKTSVQQNNVIPVVAHAIEIEVVE